MKIELRPDAMGICVYTEGDVLEGHTIEIILMPSQDVPKGESRYSCNGQCIRTINTNTNTNTNINPNTNTKAKSKSKSKSNNNTLSRPPLTLEIPPLPFPRKARKSLVQPPVELLPVPPWNTPSEKPLAVEQSKLEEPVRRNSYVIILGDDLSFTGPQLSVIVLLMAVCYYMGKFSCRC
ncbi:hypothetical protein PHYBLDRAFT_157590 [Phycomyces blakesleeanus NRRL 1555(-)]|uniref:Uncharacterized protein n=1 Tax=Phycomyces blakesleeanus (strain ATCC 8743b / DSM 1359 / FGSC 10004 / NBRC 33097 / NRRL 1555) TaxID=763407 RepID=A0A162UXF0_PHYB8|nr:hypothetical protein PHYBLDRAFT_157590 [Phycomyces blakesleeanus NRRL 1555(-)]OAD78593.1 hypothetical protein PHYBLDRAFT_157590 [Phycomyces blakesleeanus NRRL 1555(-)]|eukprot:XP_018296633.1 hypothetical protein PHYBLDRAFT_157590 [Phycomyces blakesleeanus NRRL 1555(-)]